MKKTETKSASALDHQLVLGLLIERHKSVSAKQRPRRPPPAKTKKK